MVRFKELDKVYGVYPVLDNIFDQIDSDKIRKLSIAVSHYNIMDESQICNEFYNIVGLKVHYKSVLNLFEKVYNFKFIRYSDDGERIYKNPLSIIYYNNDGKLLKNPIH